MRSLFQKALLAGSGGHHQRHKQRHQQPLQPLQASQPSLPLQPSQQPRATSLGCPGMHVSAAVGQPSTKPDQVIVEAFQVAFQRGLGLLCSSLSPAPGTAKRITITTNNSSAHSSSNSSSNSDDDVDAVGYPANSFNAKVHDTATIENQKAHPFDIDQRSLML
jgi:hypothetical protein